MIDFFKALLNKKGAKMVAPKKKKAKKAKKAVSKKTSSNKKKTSTLKKQKPARGKIKKIESEKKVKVEKTGGETFSKKRSAKEYEQIKQMLLKMKAEIMDELAKKKASLEEEKNIEIEDLDALAEDRNREYEYMLTTMDTKKLKQIDEALAKIENGTYGICEECGEEIPLARLKILPFAKLCVDCVSNIEKEEAIKQSLESEKNVFATGNNEEESDIE
jgi:DnaK suppressor protein